MRYMTDRELADYARRLVGNTPQAEIAARLGFKDPYGYGQTRVSDAIHCRSRRMALAVIKLLAGYDADPRRFTRIYRTVESAVADYLADDEETTHAHAQT